MGYVEIIYKDHSGILIGNDKIVEMAWEYCGSCRTITDQVKGTFELGTFICNSCIGTNNESA